MKLKIKNWKIVEKDAIIMGGYRKDPQWISGKSFGAKAGMIERHSGYMLSSLIPLVPTMAKLVLCRYYNQSVPQKIINKFAKYKYLDKFYHVGQKILLSMDHAQLNRFFEAFFNLPEEEIHLFMNHQVNILFFAKPTFNNLKLLTYVGLGLIRMF